MKHEDDIYKKPKRLISEYFTIVLVTCVATLFVGFEIYAFLSDDKKVSLLSGVEANITKEIVEVNSSTITSTPEIFIETKEEIETTTKDENISTLSTLVVNETLLETNTTSLAVEKNILTNPLNEVLRLKDETESWELQSSYHNYSLEDKQKLLIHAIENNHADNLSKMLKSGFHLRSSFYEGDANDLISTRKYKVVFVLLENNLLDLTKTNKDGYSLLHEASAKGHQSLIRLLISKGEDVNIQDNDGVSALHYPSRLGYSITVKTLLELGINPNLRASLKYNDLYWNESTPLHAAAQRGQLKVVKQLVLAGADITLKDGDGLTALDIAKNNNDEALTRFLESKLPQTEDKSETDTNTTKIDDVAPENLDVDKLTENLDDNTTQEAVSDEETLQSVTSESNNTDTSL